MYKLLLGFLLLPYLVFAQIQISGSLVDTEQQPLAFANVLLLQAKDSSLVKAELSDDKGHFVFKAEKGAYLLRVVLLGHKEHWQALGQTDADVSLGALLLRSSQTVLGEVEITAKKPFLEQKAGMMVVNVANSITGTDGSAMELLRKVPGMVIVQDQIRLNGRTGVSILIEGRPTQYVDMNALLLDMPAANIERIEVITQPGAKYDAQGTAGIINIILKKNVNLGLNGSITLGAGYGRLGKYRSSATINKRNERVNLSASAAFNHRTSFESLDLMRRVQDSLFQQQNYMPDFPYSLQLKAGVDYYLSPKHTIGTNISVLGSKNNSTDENNTVLFDNGVERILNVSTTNEEKRRSFFGTADLYYQFKIDTNGHQWSADASYSRFARDKQNAVRSLSTFGTSIVFPDRRQVLPGGSAIVAARVDYERPIGPYLNLEAGAKISRAEVDNDFKAEQQTPERIWIDDNGLSNHFIFEENIAAVYGNLKLRYKKIEANAGLRYEDARQTGISLTLDSVQARVFQNLFPTLNVNIPLKGKIGMAAAYSYRIDRPGYNALNPFVSYLDPYTFRQGNPFLRPEFTHSTSLSLTYDKQPFFNLQYDRSKDVIQLISRQVDSTGAAFGYNENFKRYDHIGGHLFFPLNFIKKMSGYGGGMLYYDRYRSGLFDTNLDRSAWNFTGFLQATYQWHKRFSMEVTGWFRGPGLEGLMQTNALYGVDAGLQYKFPNKRATLKLNCNNLFFKYFSGTMRFANLDTDVVSRWETRVVNASFSYTFGNQFLKAAKKRKGSADEERKRNND